MPGGVTRAMEENPSGIGFTMRHHFSGVATRILEDNISGLDSQWDITFPRCDPDTGVISPGLDSQWDNHFSGCDPYYWRIISPGLDSHATSLFRGATRILEDNISGIGFTMDITFPGATVILEDNISGIGFTMRHHYSGVRPGYWRIISPGLDSQ